MNINEYAKNNELRVNIIPNAKKNEIRKSENGILYIAIAAPPEKNRANKELCRFIRKATKREARIKSGIHTRKKILIFV